MGKRSTALATILFLAATGALLAAEPAAPTPACSATDKALPAHLAGWATPHAATAGATATGLPQAETGAGYALTLAPSVSLAYVAAPGKSPAPGGFGGMLSVEIARAGPYLAALSAPAWIDVVKDGKPLTSTAHGPGPDCSTIRKIVEFSLEPGRYVVQLAGSPGPAMTFMLAPKP